MRKSCMRFTFKIEIDIINLTMIFYFLVIEIFWFPWFVYRKALVSKQKTIPIDSVFTDHKGVFYISLLRSDMCGKSKRFGYVFDIISCTYIQFWHVQTNVQAKDVPDLCDYNLMKQESRIAQRQIFICLHFSRGHQNSHLILDEVPCIASDRSKYISGDLFIVRHFFLLTLYMDKFS
jgi:hypothetical protein